MKKILKSIEELTLLVDKIPDGEEANRAKSKMLDILVNDMPDAKFLSASLEHLTWVIEHHCTEKIGLVFTYREGADDFPYRVEVGKFNSFENENARAGACLAHALYEHAGSPMDWGDLD